MTGNGGDALERRLEALATAGDDEINDPGLGGQLGQLVAVAAGDQRHGTGRQPGGGGRRGGDAGQDGVGVRGRARAPQHDGVAGLQAQRGGIDGDVGARLVDDGDDAQRHPDAAQRQPIGQRRAIDHLADRVGQGGDLAHAGRHGGGPRRRRGRDGPAARRSGRWPRPASRSRALASRICSVPSISATAIASSAASLTPERSAASSRAARWAARQVSAIESAVLAISG